MSTHSFSIIATGLTPDDPNFENKFFEAGCDDATIAFQKGVIVLAFDREAKNLIHAVWSAVKDVERAGATVTGIEPDGLVSLSDIADRTNASRAAVSLWSLGKRGKGFPAPVARVTTPMPLWDWVQVTRWLCSEQEAPYSLAVEARVFRFAHQKAVEKDDDELRAQA